MRAGHPRWQPLKESLAPVLWRLLAATARPRATAAAPPPAPRSPVIFACLHRDILPALLYVRRWRPVLLVSQSRDGDVLIRTLRPDGFDFARGSTGPTGGPGFVRLLAALREGRCVGVAVDGPRGPFGAVRDGVMQLSRLSGRPIVPLRAGRGRYWRLRTWDRTLVPWPGAAFTLGEGPPLQVAPDAGEAEMATARDRLAALLTGGDGS